MPNHNLTPREIDILSLLAQGLSRKETAQKLGVTLNTVNTRCDNIHDKLDVHSTLDAIVAAKLSGLLKEVQNA